LLDALAKRVEIEAGGEVTLEANPDDVSVDTATAWREAGVNRLSIGAQSFDDRVLEWMHRTHDAAQIGRAVDAARQAGIDDLSIDLIFSLPDNVQRSWSTDLERVLAVEPTHVSLYGLTIEPHTPLGRWRERGELEASPDVSTGGVFDGTRGARGRGFTTRCRTSRDRGARTTIRRTGRGFHTSAWARRRTASTAPSAGGTGRVRGGSASRPAPTRSPAGGSSPPMRSSRSAPTSA
jgi:hypothetical protein